MQEQLMGKGISDTIEGWQIKLTMLTRETGDS